MANKKKKEDSRAQTATVQPSQLKLFCWVLDISHRPFAVNIAQSETVGDLAKAIKIEESHALENVDADTLILWQVSIPEAEIKNTLSVRQFKDEESLSHMSILSTLFVGDLKLQLHIVVRAPETVLPIPRKRHRAEDAPDVGPSGVYKPPMKFAQIAAIHKAIKDLPDTIDFADPAKLTMLPFPSPLGDPSQRFEWHKQDDVSRFSYMGRSKFIELYKQTQGPNFVKAYESIYFYGSSGTGKSHILAALVCLLIRQGKHVVYVPDCRTLVKNFTSTMQVAFCFAFHQHYQDIASFRTIDDLIKFSQDRVIFGGDRDRFYIIVDQYNAFEVDSDDLKREKQEAEGLLWKIANGHHFIFSASANEQSHQMAELKQSGSNVFKLLGGMGDAEMKQWWRHHSSLLPNPPLDEDQRQLVESLTGRIPLLLRALFGFRQQGIPFDEDQLLRSKDFKKVKDDIFAFHQGLKESLNWPAKEKPFYSIMSGCLRREKITRSFSHLYDHRYFTIEEERGDYTSAAAFRAATMILREQRFKMFCTPEWYSAVEQYSNDPVVQGFMAEHVCLSQIAAEGLRVVDPKLCMMDHAVFEVTPNWTNLLSSDHTLCLYVPISFNFPAVDGAILLLDHHLKVAHLFLLQITLSLRHRNSDETSYTNTWRNWTKAITDAGFKNIETTFIWIDKKQPSSEEKTGTSRTTRQGTTVVHPSYKSIHVGIQAVDPKLARALGLS